MSAGNTTLAHPEEVRAIMENGNVRAALISKSTMAEVRDAMKISHEL